MSSLHPLFDAHSDCSVGLFGFTSHLFHMYLKLFVLHCYMITCACTYPAHSFVMYYYQCFIYAGKISLRLKGSYDSTPVMQLSIENYESDLGVRLNRLWSFYQDCCCCK